MTEITKFDAFMYNAYTGFPSTPLAQVSKTAHVCSERHHVVISVDKGKVSGGGEGGGNMEESAEVLGSRERWRQLICGTFPWCGCRWR